jgi:hypothetical protein
MTITIASLALIAIGVVLALAVHGIMGGLLIALGAGGLIFSMLHVSADAAEKQREIDAQADDIRSRHQTSL